MKAQELRIGNYITLAVPPVEDYNIFVVHTINDYSAQCHLLTDEEIERNIEMDRILPIPITKEWLLRFGFKNGKRDMFYVKQYETATQGIFPGEWQVILLGSVPYTLPKSIKYAHQLQNLYFTLTGNELEIK